MSEPQLPREVRRRLAIIQQRIRHVHRRQRPNPPSFSRNGTRRSSIFDDVDPKPGDR
jgi:hypothetical protein